MALAVVALQIPIVGAMLGYHIGISWSTWYRLRHGHRP
jgi:hypothetical protein